jgi:WD40 repeat protein
VAFSPDGSTLAVTMADVSSIFLWDLEADDESSSPSSTIETNGLLSSLAYSPNGIFLAGAVDSTVKMWRASDGSLEKDLGGWGLDSSISFSPNGKLVASFEDDVVRIRNTDNGEVAVHSFEEDEEDNSIACADSVAFAPDGQTLASGGTHGNVHGFIFMWDARKFL